MRFSIIPSSQRVERGVRRFDLEGFLAECQAAESAGFYAAYCGEKHAGDTSYSSSPLILCSVALARTSTLVVGTNILILPIHHPVGVAEDAAVLGGSFPHRFRLALGAGYFAGDFEAFGVEVADRAVRTEQGMAAIDAFRRGEALELTGPWSGKVPARDPALGPDTVEVFMGAWSRTGVRRAARTADGWITDPIRGVGAIRELADLYRAECARAGRRPRIVLFREAWLGRTDEEARAVLGPHVLNYHRLYLTRGNAYDPRWDRWLAEVKRPEDLRLDHILPDRILCGGVEAWLEQLATWGGALQPEEVVLRLRHFSGPDIDATIETIHRIGREVVPAFR
ncbi:MAG: LLM class flavin-dependent oxidoreductase [Candidatus Rokubacteria bacterium]|nr:LLM class flavin-dependent oxidoreductase [Candidatus Rokubacteria bacterium]